MNHQPQEDHPEEITDILILLVLAARDMVVKEEAEEEEDIVEEEETTEVEVEVDMEAETNIVALLKSIVVRLKGIMTIPFS